MVPVLNYDRRVVLLAVFTGVPGLTASIALLWIGGYAWPVTVALSSLITGAWLALVILLRNRIVRPLQTVSNLVAALREDDFSIRARGATPEDALGQLLLEVNSLAETLRTQRLGAQEATALLRAVMDEIDVAIFAFDGQARLVLVNRFAAELLDRSADEMLGRTVTELGLDARLRHDTGVQDLAFPGRSGRWEIRRRQFWQGGQPHDLLVLADVSQPLRDEERQAWQRLIRVMGHELNNSLAPIKSITGSLTALISRPAVPPDWRDDMRRGLAVIGARAEALGRFTAAYAQLARLPTPQRRPTELGPLLHRVAGLETRVPVAVVDGPAVHIRADADQLEQLLINVIRNAVDATLETGGCVTTGWAAHDGLVDVWVDDEGPGVQNTGNLFVPFFTTKPGGSGIGLVLSRQIAEAHGGSLRLENRAGQRGARATLTLPP